MNSSRPTSQLADVLAMPLPSTAKIVFFRLNSFWQNGKKCLVSNSFLAGAIGKSKRTVQRALVALEKAGQITREITHCNNSRVITPTSSARRVADRKSVFARLPDAQARYVSKIPLEPRSPQSPAEIARELGFRPDDVDAAWALATREISGGKLISDISKYVVGMIRRGFSAKPKLVGSRPQVKSATVKATAPQYGLCDRAKPTDPNAPPGATPEERAKAIAKIKKRLYAGGG